MINKTVVICSLTDDPFAPAGRGSFGGSHIAIANVGRYLIRSGHNVLFFTRRVSQSHSPYVDLGFNCKLFRINGGPLKPVKYYMAGLYLSEMIININEILSKLKLSQPLSFISYNWLSGETVRLVREKHKGVHMHLVLALSISRTNGGERKNKITEEWCEFERKTFDDADYIFCGSREEKKDILQFYNKIKKDKLIVLNYGIDTNIFYRRPGSENNYIRGAIEKFQKGINNII